MHRSSRRRRGRRRVPLGERGPEPTIMLLYLNNQTYQGENGKKLVEELRAARKHEFPILMLHENDPQCGGCEVRQLICRTHAPSDLRGQMRRERA